jgi:dipeptidyl aminopeptidase/acylaminoacyl peptidase
MKSIVATALLLFCALPAAAQTAGSSDKRPVTVDDVLAMKAVGAAAVSPDGTQVLYTVRQWEPEKDRMESRTHVWKVAVAGGPARQITFGERGDSQPQWSPDGRHISFVSARAGGASATGSGTGPWKRQRRGRPAAADLHHAQRRR